MTSQSAKVYNRIIGFRASEDFEARLERFSHVLGRQKSDVVRYLLVSCLNAYEADRDAIAKIRQALY